jgi:hypothetical protein
MKVKADLTNQVKVSRSFFQITEHFLQMGGFAVPDNPGMNARRRIEKAGVPTSQVQLSPPIVRIDPSEDNMPNTCDTKPGHNLIDNGGYGRG